MPSEIVRKVKFLHNNWRAFPNLSVSVEGYYEPLSQTVTVASYESTDLQRYRDNPSSDFGRRFASLCAHEMTHWIDSVSTLWGRERLVEAFEAMEAAESEDESRFWKIKSYESLVKRDNLSDYYTTVLRDKTDAQNDRPWRTVLSCGLEFGPDGRQRSDRPILFYQFHGCTGGQISRVPFSTASLLEANATWSEIASYMVSIYSLPEESAYVDAAVITDKIIDRIYTLSLGEYSVAAHHLANKLRLEDITLAYRAASALATLCLNLPDEYFQALPIPDGLESFGERVDNLIKMRDRGFAFFLLGNSPPQYPTHNPFDSSATEEWLNTLMVEAGLPELHELESEVAKKLSEFDAESADTKRTDRLKRLFQAGDHNYSVRGLCGLATPTIGGLFLHGFAAPPVILGDGTILEWPTELEKTTHPRSNPPVIFEETEDSISEAIEKATRFSAISTNFMTACRP